SGPGAMKVGFLAWRPRWPPAAELCVRRRGGESNHMPPLLHGLLGFLVSVLGGGILATLGNLLYGAGARELLGVSSLPFLVLGGGAVGFLSVLFLWMRFVPVRCPRCGGRMLTAFRGRQQVFGCPACGHRQ